MWPFSADTHGLWLALYIATWCLHGVFVSYVLVGSAYTLFVKDPIADRARDLLPFMLGAGITAGVAPLLFLQLLYQERFYTANLLLGPRWGAVVPALIVGFYALYLAKASDRFRRIALAVATGCFLFVAWSWTELHLVMRDEPAWKAMYAAGDRFYGQSAVLPRLLLWLGAMPILFAALSLWLTAERKRLAVIALGGHVLVGIAVAIVHADVTAHGWLYVLVAAVVIELAGWVWMLRTGKGASLVTAAATAALVAGAIVREAPRLGFLEPTRDAAREASGFPVFAATLVLGGLAIAFISKAIRRC